ncbi:unnamed protein product, partial [Rotaria sordida]
IPKLKCFTLKSNIFHDSEFVYLKWILNNVNYVEKLKLRLYINLTYQEDLMKRHCFIDANFINEYCMPDISRNLIIFNFYILFKCELLSDNNIQIIENSFKIHQFFIDHHWIKVKCFFDPIMSYQYISSTGMIKPKFFDSIKYYSNIFDWQHMKSLKVNLCPSIDLFLKQFDILFPHITSIQFNMGDEKFVHGPEYSMFLQSSLDVLQWKLTNIHLQYITRLVFGSHFCRGSEYKHKSIEHNTVRAEILAYLISMPIQLIYLRIEHFEWLLHIVQYASNTLRKNALNSVRYAEFCLSSCHKGSNESTCIGKNLVSFLGNYTPYLQTLRIWRPDDFPWTSIRPEFQSKWRRQNLTDKWLKSLTTSQSITEHVFIFEYDLSQLIQQLKQFTFLDIYGQIDHQKIEPYRSMIQRRFPNSRVHIQIRRFCLWF